jgi:hypothetical protein
MSIISELRQLNDDLLAEALLYLPTPDLLWFEKEEKGEKEKEKGEGKEKDKRVSKILARPSFWRAKIKGISPRRPGKVNLRKFYLRLFSQQVSMNEAIEMGMNDLEMSDFKDSSLPFRKALSFGAALKGHLEKAKEIVGEKLFPSILFALHLHHDDDVSLDKLIKDRVGAQKYRYWGYRALCHDIPHDYFTTEITVRAAEYGEGNGIMFVTERIINCLFNHQSDDPLLDLIRRFPYDIEPYRILNLIDEAKNRANSKDLLKYYRTRERVIKLFNEHPDINYPQYHAKVMYEIITPRPLDDDDLYQIRDHLYRGGGIDDITGQFYDYTDPMTKKNYLFAIGLADRDAKFEGGNEEIWGDEEITVELKPARWEIIEYRKGEHSQFMGEDFDNDDDDE